MERKMDGESPYVLRIRGANRLKDTCGRAWEPQAYVIVSTLRREFRITLPMSLEERLVNKIRPLP